MPRPRLGEKKKLTHYESAAAQRRAEMQRHFEALAAACWRMRYVDADQFPIDRNQSMARTKGGAKC